MVEKHIAVCTGLGKVGVRGRTVAEQLAVDKAVKLKESREALDNYGFTYRYGLELYEQINNRKPLYVKTVDPIVAKLTRKGLSLINNNELDNAVNNVKTTYPYPEKPVIIDISLLTLEDEKELIQAIESEL